jgi:hypothetical protein
MEYININIYLIMTIIKEPKYLMSLGTRKTSFTRTRQDMKKDIKNDSVSIAKVRFN